MDSDLKKSVNYPPGKMFNSMKNQFREKTGRELPKFTPQKGGLSRQSRQGSESSVCSLVLENPQQVPLASSPTLSSQDSVQIKVPDTKNNVSKDINYIKKEEEWKQKLKDKDMEWAKTMEKKEQEWRTKEHALTEDLLKQTHELKEALKMSEERRRQFQIIQEDKDSLQKVITSEMSHLKQMLLSKEQECLQKASELQETSTLMESMKTELNRLKPLEKDFLSVQDDLEMLRHTSEKERWNLCSKLAQSEEQVRHLTDKVAVLTRRSESDAAGLISALPPDDRVQALLGERVLLERRLEEAHVHLTDIKASWSAQISSLETQVGRLSRQAGEEGSERRSAEAKVSELEAKLEDEAKERKTLQTRVTSLTSECNSLANELKEAHTAIASKDGEIADSLKKSTELQSSLEESTRLKEQVADIQSKLLKSKTEFTAAETVFNAQNKSLQELLNTERDTVISLQKDLDKERAGKDEALLQNAQISQEVDIVRRELLQQQSEIEEYLKKMTQQETTLKEKDSLLTKHKQDIQALSTELTSLKNVDISAEKGLREKISDLEDQVIEKNKAIKLLKQKLVDLKKTLQRELKITDSEGVENLNNHNFTIPTQSNKDNPDNEVNFLYMKNVIMKFLTSREYEALHLTKAVATLLKLSAEEECLLKDTIGWRMSWFRSKPRPQDYTQS